MWGAGERKRINKRILKRHRCQVSRANDRVRLSEPDLRTPEQLTAARDVSRSIASRHCVPHPNYATPSIRNAAGPPAEGAPKAEEQ
jgi:hypothetical protein